MSRLFPPRKNFSLIAWIALVVVPVTVFAGRGGILDQTGCSVCCPECKHTCKLNAEEIEVEKTCWEVESKVICIPRVVFPWQTAMKKKCASCTSCDGKGCTDCVHNGARTRTICVVKPKKYKCPSCKYTWSTQEKDCCDTCGPSCEGQCDSATCVDSQCDFNNGMILSSPMPLMSPDAADQGMVVAPIVGVVPHADAKRRPSPLPVGLVKTRDDVRH